MDVAPRPHFDHSLQGVIPIVPTPFTDQEEIDHEALTELVEFEVSTGVKGICLPTYGSEFYKLTETERRQAISTVVKAAGKRVQIVAQSNHPSYRAACDLARLYQDLGADVISFAIPRQFLLAEADILRYCEAIVKAMKLPVLIQDFNPGGPTVSEEFVKCLLETTSTT